MRLRFDIRRLYSRIGFWKALRRLISGSGRNEFGDAAVYLLILANDYTKLNCKISYKLLYKSIYSRLYYWYNIV